VWVSVGGPGGALLPGGKAGVRIGIAALGGLRWQKRAFSAILFGLMRRTFQTLGAVVLLWLVAGAACSGKKRPDEARPPAGGGGEGGESSSEAGSGPRAGSAGKGTGGTKASAGDGSGASGGEGGSPTQPQCPGCASGFCLDDGTCVDCLASNDQCPQGQYCTDANECAPGCKADGSSCASGVCNAEHNCENCLSDDECIAPLVCGNGTCSAACTQAQEGTANGCELEGLTCCSLHCVDVTTDSQHCGSCGTACGAGQFCGNTECPSGGEGGAGGAGAGTACVTCHDTTLANLCAITKVIVILDSSTNPSDGNRVTGLAIGQALGTNCSPAPEVIEAEQDSAEALNFRTGRPVSGGGELLVLAGGPFYQVVQGYLEEAGAAPLYWFVGDGFSAYQKTADDQPVVSLPLASDHESHDFFIIQFMRDPTSGSLVLNAQGLWLSGTVAAAFQMENAVLPNLASYDQAWYAYEWTDADGDRAPDTDEIDLVDSGT
jgi:hypothetical protein